MRRNGHEWRPACPLLGGCRLCRHSASGSTQQFWSCSNLQCHSHAVYQPPCNWAAGLVVGAAAAPQDGGISCRARMDVGQELMQECAPGSGARSASWLPIRDHRYAAGLEQCPMPPCIEAWGTRHGGIGRGGVQRVAAAAQGSAGPPAAASTHSEMIVRRAEHQERVCFVLVVLSPSPIGLVHSWWCKLVFE
jgi:hypothetical protein